MDETTLITHGSAAIADSHSAVVSAPRRRPILIHQPARQLNGDKTQTMQPQSQGLMPQSTPSPPAMTNSSLDSPSGTSTSQIIVRIHEDKDGATRSVVATLNEPPSQQHLVQSDSPSANNEPFVPRPRSVAKSVPTTPGSRTNSGGAGGGGPGGRLSSTNKEAGAGKRQSVITPATPTKVRSPHHKGGNMKDEPKTVCGRIHDAVISLRFAFMFMVISSLVIVSVLSWNLTFQAAQNSINLVTDDYSSVLISQIAADVDRRLVAAEHATALNKHYFASGLLDYNNRPVVLYTMYRQITTLVVDTISSMSMTTKEGDLNGLGYYFPPNQPPELVQWTGNGGHLIEQQINATTYEKLAVNFDVTDVDDSQAAWYQCVDVSDPNGSGWTEPYIFYNNWFVSQSRTLLNSTGGLLGVITSDIQLGFTDIIAKQLAAASNVGAEFFIINSATGAILGTSIQGFPLSNNTDPNNVQAVYLFSSTSTSTMQSLHEWIVKESGQSESTTSPDQIYVNVPQMHGEVHIDGRQYLVSVKPFAHGVETNPIHNIHWLFIHVLDRSTIESQIATSNTKVLISVVCICGGFIIATSLLLWYSMRLINHLSVVLTSFARFEFSDHVAGGQLKSRSIFTELKEMQAAVLEMTRSFKKHLDMKQSLFNQYLSSSSGGAGGVSSTLSEGPNHTQLSSGPRPSQLMPLTTRPKSTVSGSSAPLHSTIELMPVVVTQPSSIIHPEGIDLGLTPAESPSIISAPPSPKTATSMRNEEI